MTSHQYNYIHVQQTKTKKVAQNLYPTTIQLVSKTTNTLRN